jgi:hypothetical protein
MDEREKFGNEGAAGGRLKELTSIQIHFSFPIFLRHQNFILSVF